MSGISVFFVDAMFGQTKESVTTNESSHEVSYLSPEVVLDARRKLVKEMLKYPILDRPALANDARIASLKAASDLVDSLDATEIAEIIAYIENKISDFVAAQDKESPDAYILKREGSQKLQAELDLYKEARMNAEKQKESSY